MRAWFVEVAAAAEEDLSDAALYIRDVLLSPQAAIGLVDSFEARVYELSKQPMLHPLVRDSRLAHLGYRWAPVAGYMAFYIVNEAERTVYVERLLYSRSDWRAIL